MTKPATKTARKPAAKKRGRPFEKGNKLGSRGRPRGSRNKLGEAFIQALHDDFIDHGPATLARVREEKPEVYMQVCARLLPTQAELNITGSAFEKLWTAISEGQVPAGIGPVDEPATKTKH